jgi:hypothetical protein
MDSSQYHATAALARSKDPYTYCIDCSRADLDTVAKEKLLSL